MVEDIGHVEHRGAGIGCQIGAVQYQHEKTGDQQPFQEMEKFSLAHAPEYTSRDIRIQGKKAGGFV